ncbi:hypothetical protein AAFF_G00078890 [Aldrovandia affinis]|uniref:Uncharacterized protein n=1 Tax=Aldrovandia affinis TaxID=143900 RepID=A0AAD7WCW3_9TELE|nr:hypothetical protein AAFF_G00078890 [Aldrovandia affinis]
MLLEGCLPIRRGPLKSWNKATLNQGREHYPNVFGEEKIPTGHPALPIPAAYQKSSPRIQRGPEVRRCWSFGGTGQARAQGHGGGGAVDGGRQAPPFPHAPKASLDSSHGCILSRLPHPPPPPLAPMLLWEKSRNREQ